MYDGELGERVCVRVYEGCVKHPPEHHIESVVTSVVVQLYPAILLGCVILGDVRCVPGWSAV